MEVHQPAAGELHLWLDFRLIREELWRELFYVVLPALFQHLCPSSTELSSRPVWPCVKGSCSLWCFQQESWCFIARRHDTFQWIHKEWISVSESKEACGDCGKVGCAYEATFVVRLWDLVPREAGDIWKTLPNAADLDSPYTLFFLVASISKMLKAWS